MGSESSIARINALFVFTCAPHADTMTMKHFTLYGNVQRARQNQTKLDEEGQIKKWMSLIVVKHGH